MTTSRVKPRVWMTVMTDMVLNLSPRQGEGSAFGSDSGDGVGKGERKQVGSYGFTEDTFYAFAEEDEVVWLEDPFKYDYVREGGYSGMHRRNKPRCPGEAGSRLVGYSTCKKTCNHDDVHYRRLWWLKPHDRDFGPDRERDSNNEFYYKPGITPAEAVDPRTIKVGAQSDLTDRAIWGDRAPERKRKMASAYEATVQFFKDGDVHSIVTDATSEDAFMASSAGALGQMIEEDRYKGEWELQLGGWLPEITNIVAKLRGYKAPEVYERRILIAGRTSPKIDDLVYSRGPGLASVHPVELIKEAFVNSTEES